MLQVVDGQIVKHSLPKTGVLKDGRTVSGYDALPAETLAAEGWLDDTRGSYSYDEATEQLEGPFVDGGAIVYNVVAKPEPVEPDAYIGGITLTADKAQITANGVDTATVTATFDGHNVDSIPCYITVNGPPAEQAEISGGEVVREFVSEEAGFFRVDVFAGDAQKTIFIEAV